jgi:hypothetical protein
MRSAARVGAVADQARRDDRHGMPTAVRASAHRGKEEPVKTRIIALALVSCLLTLIGCATDDIMSTPAVLVTSAELAASSPEHPYVIDTTGEDSLYVLDFEDPAQLRNVQVLSSKKEFSLYQAVKLDDARRAGRLVIGDDEVKVMSATDKGCVCVKVCCWHYRCYCNQNQEPSPSPMPEEPDLGEP